MIKANELRVGNIIVSEGGIIRSVTGHDIKEQWWHEGDPHGSAGASINPIALTPERLERCGFTFDLFAGYYVYELPNKPQGIDSIKVGSGVYLHQLQNLYFAITGEEIQIKMP
jgi:hypothetical protein